MATPEQIRARLRLRQRMEAERNRPQGDRNPDGTYGQPPADMFRNPETGQMTSRDMLRANADPGRGMAALGGAMQGVGFNFGDEAAGLAGRIEGGPEMARFRREQARAQLERSQQEAPMTSLGATVGGGLLSALATAPAAGLARTTPGMMGIGAGLGAAEGAAFGYGRGEDAASRRAAAANDGLLGALIGGAAPAVVQGAGAAARTIGLDRGLGWVGSKLTGRPDQTRANRALSETMRRAGTNADEVTSRVNRARELGQPEYRAVDAMGDAGQRRLSGLARSNDEAASEITQFLENRQIDQRGRVAGFVDDAFETGGETSRQQTARLESGRSARANEAYDAARRNAAPVDVRGALSAIDGEMGNVGDAGVRLGPIDRSLAAVRDRLAGSLDGQDAYLSDFDRVLRVKQDLADEISAASRAGNNNQVRILSKVQKELDAALEAASPAYRRANDDFAAASREIEAVQIGKDMATGRRRPEDNADTFAALSGAGQGGGRQVAAPGQYRPDERAAARTGYANERITGIVNKPPFADTSRDFLTPRGRADAETMLRDPQRFIEQMQNESTMFTTQAKAIQGSRTAQNLADQEGAAQAVEGAAAVARRAGNFSFGDAVATVFDILKDRASGLDDSTRQIMARALLSGDPEQVLRAAERSNMSAEARSQIASAMGRASGVRLGAERR